MLECRCSTHSRADLITGVLSGSAAARVPESSGKAGTPGELTAAATGNWAATVAAIGACHVGESEYPGVFVGGAPDHPERERRKVGERDEHDVVVVGLDRHGGDGRRDDLSLSD